MSTESNEPRLPYATVDDVASDVLSFRHGDLFNPPGLTNFWGCCQAALDPVAIQHLTFAPYSHGDLPLGVLTLNGRCPGKSGNPIRYHWRPDRILREMTSGGFHIVSQAVMPLETQAVLVSVEIRNELDEQQVVDLRLRSDGGVIWSRDGWHTPYAPKEGPTISVTPWEGTPPPETLVTNERTIDDGGFIVYRSRTSKAVALHGTYPRPDALDRSEFTFRRTLEPGASFQVMYAVFVGDDAAALRAQYEAWETEPGRLLEETEEDWNAELEAVFTPGNDRYSGSLPRLLTEHDDLRRIYLMTMLGAVYLKRTHPDSAYGRSYATLMPRYWMTSAFINDWSLSAYLLVLLDPDCVRRHVELWLRKDIHGHHCTEYVSGDTSGNWYSCNDFAMVRLIGTYVRVTGDHAWLDEVVAGRTVLEHVRAMATHYKELDGGHGLADGGDRNSLLECVGSYTHEVASINAGYVWALREAAALYEHRGDDETAETLRQDATTLIEAIQKLYIPGEGFWNARQPDGTLVPVRHAWDFVHVFNHLYDDLPAAQRAEMMSFFTRELQTPEWMHALSPRDPDADFSVRPDHQWNGSWTDWVAYAAYALALDGRWQQLADWLPGIAKASNQGPYSQAHFVEAAAPLHAGGARKAPTEWPFITDWAALAVGGFHELIFERIFGLDFGLDALTAEPQVEALDPGAVLEDVRHGSTCYRVDRTGVFPVGSYA